MGNKIILSSVDLSKIKFEENVEIVQINAQNIEKHNNNPCVIAIIGTPGLAIKCANLTFPQLKLFQLTSAGFDNVPCDTYAINNVAVANTGNVYSIPIAETVVFGVLQIAKKIRQNPNNRHYNLFRGYSKYITELNSKKVLIMGAGNIGTAVATRLLPFGMEIDGYDPYCPTKPQYNNILRSRDELKLKLSEYDFIISTLPDNSETRNFINKELFDCMKRNVVIVNVGRKTVFNEADFYNALKAKQLGGAVLDMFEKIPNPITNKFRRLHNVIVLPGVSAISKEVQTRLKEHVLTNINHLLNNEPIENVINGVK